MKRPPLLLLGLLTLPAPAPAAPVPVEARLAGSREGVVLELVSLAGPERRLALSGGKADAPEAGFWRVMARAQSSAPMAFDLLPLIEPAVTPALRLTPARRLEVRVTDPAGQPLAASLRVEPAPQKETGEPAWSPAPVEGVTRADGAAALEAAPSVTLRLTVAAPGFVTERIEVDPRNLGEIRVRLTPGMARTLEVTDAGKPVAGVAVMTGDGMRLGATDKTGRLQVTLPRGEDAALKLLALDCRWLDATVRRDSPATLSFTLKSPKILRGKVLDRQTRQPLAAAWVWADDIPSCSTRTVGDGSFSAALPGFPEVSLRAAAAGHQSEALLPGPAQMPIVLALAPVETRTALGRVVDLQGRPVAGAEVSLKTAASEEPLAAFTDAEGRFRINRMGPGVFDLQARAHGFLPTRVRQVTVPPGKGNADLGVIALQPGTAIEGRVVDPNGDPVEGATVTAAPATGLTPEDLPADGKAPAWQGVTGGDGAFSLSGFREGEALTLRVSRRGFATRTLTGLETPFPEPLTVELTPAARIAGTVVDEDGNPVAAAKLMLAEEPREPGPARGRFVAGAETDAAGRFELLDLAPGRFRLSALTAGYLAETRGGLDLKAGGGMEGIDLTLRRGARIEGRVLSPDGSPAAGARVLAVQESADLGLAGRPEAFTDDEGHYELGGLAEGDRTVMAEHAGSRPARAQVRVGPGVNELDLRLGRALEVSGRVSGPEGPMAGASLRLSPLDGGGGASDPVTSGPDGGFRFPEVGEGRYRIEAGRPGYASVAEEIRVAGSPLTGLEIRLERGGAVTGRILGLPFQDLAQVEVVASSPGRTGQRGQVDYEGRYRIEGLGPGEWKVIATLPSRGRQAGGRVSLAGERAEGRLDLEFTAGFTLSGRVERGGSPLTGALVLVEGGDGGGGNAVTGPDGRFRVGGLAPGAYSLTALDPRTNLRADQRLEIEGDREVLVTLPR